jgi:glycogen debranching enzyme
VTIAIPHRQHVLQPLLHDLVAIAAAPTSVLSGHDGQIRAQGVQGVFHADCRVLSEAVLRVDGGEPEAIADMLDGWDRARFVSLARHLGDDGADPTVRIDRVRQVAAGGLTEEVRVVSTASVAVRATVTIDLGCDLAPIEVVKSGGGGTPRPVRRDGTGQGAELVWSTDRTRVRVTGDDGVHVDEAPARLSWSVELAPGATVTLRWRLRIDTSAAVVIAARGPVEWAQPVLVADDRRLVRLLDRSLADLRSLRLAEASVPADTFLGAGVPWYLTLFGRDSIWAARMMLPVGTELAASTLRVLARRQGQRVDGRSGEAPGKIMHELRYGGFFGITDAAGPVAYYGTVDATPLWISLLHDAWRWGMPEDEVAALLPHLRSALGWLAEHADPDGDGFLEYVDVTGRGLANQGWKDSGDSVRFRDGRLGRAPVALCEVQGYAYQAAVQGAALLSAFGLDGADRWLRYAAELADRFRARYWVDGPDGPHPAMALDGDKRPVDALTSNIGHLLGTGLLSDEESALVARRLAAPAMAGGFGLRTMSTGDAGFSPLSYHCGSIWPHDTAIVIAGLARAGFGRAAAALVEGVLVAAEAFDYRLPEVYGGDDREVFGRPVPYPASCRPQAWSAAASLVIVQAALGLEPDVPAGELVLRPMPGAPFGAIEARGLRIAGRPVDVALDRAGRVSVTGLPDSVRVSAGVQPTIPAQVRGEHAGRGRPGR